MYKKKFMPYDLFLYKFGLNIFTWGISSCLFKTHSLQLGKNAIYILLADQKNTFFICFFGGNERVFERVFLEFIFVCIGSYRPTSRCASLIASFSASFICFFCGKERVFLEFIFVCIGSYSPTSRCPSLIASLSASLILVDQDVVDQKDTFFICFFGGKECVFLDLIFVCIGSYRPTLRCASLIASFSASLICFSGDVGRCRPEGARLWDHWGAAHGERSGLRGNQVRMVVSEMYNAGQSVPIPRHSKTRTKNAGLVTLET